MSSSDEPNLKAFVKILNFMKELANAFGTEFPQVAKYYALCKKTTMDNTTAINKQNGIFSAYCESNKDAIKNANASALSEAPISYTEKFSFNLKAILEKSDKDTTKVIFTHLQVISCILNPDEELKTALTSKPAPQKGGADSIIKSLMDDVSSSFAQGDSKEVDLSMSSINNKISEFKTSGKMIGFVEKIAKEIESGNCTENDIINQAASMLNQVKSEAGDDPQLSGVFNMIGGLLGSLGMPAQQ